MISSILIESYSEARKKLKKAEMTSDVNTDIDDKTQRKVRAKKQIYTDNESDCSNNQSCLPSFPKPPMIQTSNINILLHYYNCLCIYLLQLFIYVYTILYTVSDTKYTHCQKDQERENEGYITIRS